MPAPTRPASPPIMTPSHPTTRKSSNNTSYSPTVISGNSQQKMSIVTRVAIEGKAKRGRDGASIKMFLKVHLTTLLLQPIIHRFTLLVVVHTSGYCYPWIHYSTLSRSARGLFPFSSLTNHVEENVKVLKSQVHPLDHNSVPYDFSSTLSPFLRSAARALNLPQSGQASDSVLKMAKTRSKSSDRVPSVDIHYTGQILVSGYNIAFVVPKEIPPRHESQEESYLKTPKDARARSRSEDEVDARTPVKHLISIGERKHAQFMAAVDMWVPFLSKPPRLPFLVCSFLPFSNRF